MKNFRPLSLKKEVGHFSRNLWPWICKKSQKISKFLKKFFFRSKRPKTPYNSFATPFVQSTTNFRPVSLKKEVGHFSRNLWPRICKKSQKISNFWKKIFSLETTLNALKFVRNTICAVHDKFQAGISQKRSWSFFKKSVTPDMQKKSKNFQFSKKIFFAQNNLKYLKICSQHHLCSPRQISGRYLSKKKLVIFQETCDPGYAKKVTKIANFQEKKIFRSKQPKTP